MAAKHKPLKPCSEHRYGDWHPMRDGTIRWWRACQRCGARDITDQQPSTK